MTCQVMLLLKLQHVQGTQTISRAELAAVAWIVQQAVNEDWHQQVVIKTDSQYVIDTINQTVCSTTRAHTQTFSRLFLRLGHRDVLYFAKSNHIKTWHLYSLDLKKTMPSVTIGPTLQPSKHVKLTMITSMFSTSTTMAQ